MTPLYILGLILREGPQHGYQIRKAIAEQLADFAEIKLPTIYYHLARMEAAGLLTAGREKPDARPEKTVYALTAAGERAFRGMLEEALALDYRPRFAADAVLFFSDQLEPGALAARLAAHAAAMEERLGFVEAHRAEALEGIPPAHRAAAGALFDHHIRHYRAEMEWAEGARRALKEGQDGEAAGG